ncbi:unnamed protein product [Pedinophyceae sp. YPF-701]|nr:unnamed protein product [Pedinophyceae sp. YPF-701]
MDQLKMRRLGYGVQPCRRARLVSALHAPSPCGRPQRFRARTGAKDSPSCSRQQKRPRTAFSGSYPGLCRSFSFEDKLLVPSSGDSSDESESDEASDELRELALEQLSIMGDLLAPAASSSAAGGTATPALPPPLRTTLYTRKPSSYISRQLVMVRLCSWESRDDPPTDGGGASTAPAPPRTSSTVQWPPLGIPGSPGIETAPDDEDDVVVLSGEEDSLVAQQWIDLPDAGSVVVPLSRGGFLVGMLVVDRGVPGSYGAAAWGGAARGQDWAGADRPLLGSGDGVGDVVDDGVGARGGVSVVEASAGSPAPLCDEDKAQVLRVAQVLALACALDQRALLARVQSMHRRKALRRMIDETRGPLSAIRTLGTMLLPRMRDEAAGRDLATGMVTQGMHLQELVRNLQSALYGTPTVPQFVESPDTVTSASGLLPAGSSRVASAAAAAAATAMAATGDASVSSAAAAGAAAAAAAANAASGSNQPVESGPPPRSLLPPPRRESTEPPQPAKRRTWECDVRQVLAQLLGTALRAASAMGVMMDIGDDLFLSSPPTSSPSRPQPPKPARPAPDAEGESSGLGAGVPTLSRPVSPLIAGVEAGALRRALGHVLDSALQRSPRGGVVRVRAARVRDGRVCVSVRDDGGPLTENVTSGVTADGITPSWGPEGAASLQDALERMQSGLPAGTGAMGLRLASLVLRSMGGALEVASAENAGTEVRVLLPQAQEGAAG